MKPNSVALIASLAFVLCACPDDGPINPFVADGTDDMGDDLGETDLAGDLQSDTPGDGDRPDAGDGGSDGGDGGNDGGEDLSGDLPDGGRDGGGDDAIGSDLSESDSGPDAWVDVGGAPRPPPPAGPAPESYPGTDVIELTPEGEAIWGVYDFPNGGRPGQGILLVTTSEGRRLWLSSYDCDEYSPLIEIEGGDPIAAVSTQDVELLFLNGVAGRNGDAVLLFKRGSVGDDHTDDGNLRLFSVYHDRSEALDESGTAIDGSEVTYGFETTAQLVDDDPGSDTALVDFDVESLGWVSDGLVFSGRYDRDENPLDRSQDDVAFAYAVWTQNSTTTGRRVWYRELELEGTKMGFAGEAQVLGTGAVDMDPVDSVLDTLLHHNGLLVWLLVTDNLDSDDNDVFLLGTHLDEPDGPLTQLWSREDDDVSDQVIPSLPNHRNLYGPDHGIPGFLYLFTEQGYQVLDEAGPRADLVGVSVTAAREVITLELDPFNTPNEPEVDRLITVLNRTGSHLFAVWFQDHWPVPTAEERPTPSVVVRAIETTTGVTSAPLRINGTVLSADTDHLSRAVANIALTQGLADGSSNRRGSFQSDPMQLDIAFIQEVTNRDSSGGENPDLDEDRLELRYTQVTLVDEGETLSFTGLSGPPSDRLIASIDRDYLTAFEMFFTTTVAAGPAGEPWVYYVGQATSPDDDTTLEPLTMQPRLYGWTPTAGIELLSSPVPVPSDVAVTVDWGAVQAGCRGNTRRWEGRDPLAHHALMFERTGVTGDSTASRHRLIRDDGTEPVLAMPPVRIDRSLPGSGAESIRWRLGLDESIDTYSVIDGGLWWNRYHPGAGWQLRDDVSAPVRIDIDGVEGFRLGSAAAPRDCPTQSCTPVYYWTRGLDEALRLFARVRL